MEWMQVIRGAEGESSRGGRGASGSVSGTVQTEQQQVEYTRVNDVCMYVCDEMK